MSDHKREHVKVINDPVTPVPQAVLAASIVKMGHSLEALLNSGLNEHAIVVLVSAETHVSRRDIKLVLDCLRDLRRLYCGK